MRRALLLAAAMIAIATSLPEASEELQGRVERLSQEADRLTGELSADARTAGAVERDLSALIAELARLASREAAAREALAERRAQLSRLVSALAWLARAPAPAILAHPDAPLAAARAAALLERIGPALIEEAHSVEAAIQDLARLREEGEAAREKLEASAAELAVLREKLEAELADRRRELAEAEDKAGAELQAQALVRALAAAESFEETLNRAAPDAPASPSFDAALGDLTPPLHFARLQAAFGAAPEEARPGTPQTGLWLQGSPHGAVLAPWAGEIVFAGPFRLLRNVIILQPETGYLIVLGGLATLSHQEGDQVKAGDLLGRLDGPMAPTEEFLVEMTAMAGEETHLSPENGAASDELSDMLYMEIRVNGKPTDPAPWLRSEEKVSGL